MKKILAILLAVMMLFALVSCGDKAKVNKKTETKKTSTVTETQAEETTGTTDSKTKEITEGEIVTATPSETSTTDTDKGEDRRSADTGKTEDSSTPIEPEQGGLDHEGEKIGFVKKVELPIIDPNAK